MTGILPMTRTAVPESTRFFGHPTGLTTLFFTEMWERFSYYGMRALLILFMTAAIAHGGMGLDDRTATAIYGLYTAAVYLTSLPGGWIADRLIGQQRSVWYGGLIIAAGHFTLALPSHQTFYIGLVLIVLGTGLLKTNTSALVGGLYPENSAARDAGFSIYYMGINLGAFLGAIICGWLGQKVNWHYGFAAAGVGMVFGLLQYRLTRWRLGNVGIEAVPAHAQAHAQSRFLRRSWLALIAGLGIIVLLVVVGYTGTVHYAPVSMAIWAGLAILALGLGFLAWLLFFGKLNLVERKRILALAILFLVQVLFWAGFEQSGSNFNLFAERYTRLSVFGYAFPASWFQSEDPLLIILLAPFFAWIWVALGRRNMDPSTPMKFALGLLFLGMSFLVMVGAAWIVVAGHKALPVWLATTYLLHTIGELCLSPVGLSATTRLSPKRYASRLMGTWFLFMALGELLAGLIAGRFTAHNVNEMPHMYASLAAMLIAVGLLMVLLSRPIQRRLIGDPPHDASAS